VTLNNHSFYYLRVVFRTIIFQFFVAAFDPLSQSRCMRETKENVTDQINASFYKWEFHWIYSNWKRNTDVELWVTSKGQKYLSILFYPLLAQKEVIEQDRNIFFCLSDVAYIFHSLPQYKYIQQCSQRFAHFGPISACYPHYRSKLGGQAGRSHDFDSRAFL